MKVWRILGKGRLLEGSNIFEDISCPKCGDELEVYTNASEDHFQVGDSVRCVNCDFISKIKSYNDGSYYIENKKQ